jgi:iron complex outermembrane recepter protein
MKLTQYISVSQISLFILLLTIDPVAARELGDRAVPFHDRSNLSFSAGDIPEVEEQGLRPSSQKLAQNSQQALTRVTGVEVKQTDSGLELILLTVAGSERLVPLILPEGNDLVIDILDATLAFDIRNGVEEINPAEGINKITVNKIDESSIRVRITGEKQVPSAEVVPGSNLVLSVTPEGNTAQQAPDEEIEIIATGEAEEDDYKVDNTTTATRTDTPLRDVPQSIQVIPQKVIEDQQITRISDAVRNVSGVTVVREYGDYSDAYNIRGFDTYSTLRNGFAGFSTVVPSSNIDRVEVLKGPASVLYGQFEPGGVVNYITKQPLSEPYYAAEFTIGNYDFYNPTIDLSGPLTNDKKLLYRLNADYTSSGSFVDFVERDVFSISPSLSYEFSDETSLALSYDYIQSDGVHYDGFAPDSRVFDAPIERFLGEPEVNQDETERHNINATFSHRFNDSLEFRSNFAVLIDRTENALVRPRSIDEDGRTVLRSFDSNPFNDSDSFTLQNNLIAKFDTGSIKHQLLLGFDWSQDNQENANLYLEDAEVPAIDLFDPEYGSPLPTQLNGIDAASDRKTENYALYLQDQITLLPNLKFLAGGRYDFIDNRTIIESFRGENIISAEGSTEESFEDEAFSPRLGIVYQPIEPISLYASYSRSFAPNNTETATGVPIEPSRGTQYEIGVKYELNNQLSATFAAYEITKTNVPTTDPENPDFSIGAGEVKSRGLEFDIGGEILPGWNLIASAYVNDAFVSEDNSLPEGDTLVNAPHQGASIWTTYEIQEGNWQGFGFGGGLFFAEDREAELPNNLELPSYVRADATLFYNRDNWRVGLNFKNLFDTEYYESQGFWIRPGAPFTVLGSVSVEF